MKNGKVIVAGSRSINDWEYIFKLLDTHESEISEVVSGGAKGVDTWGEIWAEASHIPYIQFPAEWDKYGKQAGYLRNQQMAEYADALIAIWDGQSKGTKHMIDIMTKMNKPVFVYEKQ